MGDECGEVVVVNGERLILGVLCAFGKEGGDFVHLPHFVLVEDEREPGVHGIGRQRKRKLERMDGLFRGFEQPGVEIREREGTRAFGRLILREIGEIL